MRAWWTGPSRMSGRSLGYLLFSFFFFFFCHLLSFSCIFITATLHRMWQASFGSKLVFLFDLWSMVDKILLLMIWRSVSFYEFIRFESIIQEHNTSWILSTLLNMFFTLLLPHFCCPKIAYSIVIRFQLVFFNDCLTNNNHDSWGKIWETGFLNC